MEGFRSLQVPVLWGTGLELNKATVGHGMRGGSPAPDGELVEALWGWDGTTGCRQAYIPAERPVAGPDAYEKLLAWPQHRCMLRAVVRAGVPDITYGVIVGLPSDSRRTLEDLVTHIALLRAELKDENPELRFRVVPYAVRPLPGTSLTESMSRHGLIRFSDPAILGGFWTACADTHHMSYSEVSDWQQRITAELSDSEPAFQGITAMRSTRTDNAMLAGGVPGET